LNQANKRNDELESKLMQADSRLVSSEAERAAAEERAKTADIALRDIEDAIRTKLLTATRRSFLKVETAA
jgi:hypothetical protein